MIELIACSQCGKSYPDEGAPYRCVCGGMFDFSNSIKFLPPATGFTMGGIWRHVQTIAFSNNEPRVTLGEGNTPLLPAEFGGRQVFLKMETQNPTGSYKDRGSVTLVDFLRSRGINEVVEDSSGNAGASLAAYAARAGIKARIYAPQSTSGPKRIQIERYGADLVLVPGPRSAATDAVLDAVEKGSVYASHAYMPFGLPGIATIAFELVEQLTLVPGTVIAPVGHGGLLYGIMLGFEGLLSAGRIGKMPSFIGVQPENCAPLTNTYEMKSKVLCEMDSRPTIAEGTSVTKPARANAILSRFYSGVGSMQKATEKQIQSAYLQLASQGIYCEPTSALSLIPVLNDKIEIEGPIVAVLTGSGLKANPILDEE